MYNNDNNQGNPNKKYPSSGPAGGVGHKTSATYSPVSKKHNFNPVECQRIIKSNCVNTVNTFGGYAKHNEHSESCFESLRNRIIQELGYAPEEIEADGKIHRFATKDNYSDKAGYYAVYNHGDLIIAIYGDWRTGVQNVWYNKKTISLTKSKKWPFSRSSKRLKRKETNGIKQQL